MKAIALMFIKVYQWTISPLIGQTCRFYPSCSEYAVGAIEKHGVFAGSWLAMKRIVKCGPWHPGGVDDP